MTISKNKSFSWREFLKPNKRKLLVFLFVFFLLPFPIMEDQPRGLSWVPMPLSGPAVFFGIIFNLILHMLYWNIPDLAEYLETPDIYFILLYLFVYPAVSYLLACLFVLIYDKRKKK